MRLRVNTVVTRHNWSDLPELVELFEGIPIDHLLLIPVDEKNDQRLGLNRKMIRTFNEEVAPGLAARGLELGLFKSSTEAFAGVFSSSY